MRIGTVESLWRCSWGWWRITIWVAVEMGSDGSEPQRHTFSGLPQPSQIRRRDSDRPSTPERSRWLNSSSRSMREEGGIDYRGF